MAGTGPSMNIVELSNRIKVRADYEVVIAAFEDLDADSNMATDFTTKVTKTTTDAGSQLGKDGSGLKNIQAKAKHIVLVFARNFAAWRMRRGQGQEHGSSGSIEVTRYDVARAKKAINRMVRVLGLSSLVVERAKPVAQCTEQQAMDDRHAAEIARLEAKMTDLEAKNADLEARITETKMESTKLEDQLPLLQSNTEYIYTNQGGGGAPEPHIGGDGENDLASTEADLGSEPQEDE